MTEEAAVDSDQAEETDLKGILGQEKCTLQNAQNAEKIAKFHLSQQKENQFFAESVMLKENQDFKGNKKQEVF